MTTRYTNVLLDLDHTLLDTETSLGLAFIDAMQAVGAEPEGAYEIFNEINQALWRQVEAQELTPPQVHLARFEELNSQLGLGADASVMGNAFAHGMGAHGELYPGARDMLDAIFPSAALALVTNGLTEIQRARIERLDLGQYFDAVTISAEVGASKPGTEIFDITFAALGNPSRSGALMVGDNLGSDIAGGKNYNIDTCWYNPSGRPVSGELQPTFEIASLHELIDIVGAN